MTERSLKAGTTMFFGAPANPMPDVIADAIGQVVAQVAGIREAYLPQCFIEGDQEARQVLVIGVDHASQIPSIMDNLLGKMKLVLPERQFIDILPFQSSVMPSEARVRQCEIFQNPTRPWWRLW